ncbi:MAG: 30S ribosomal protein S16 [Patescibacteria group bacterium]
MLKLKLSRTGKKGYANYKLIVAEAKSKRDGRYLEELGTYNPNLSPSGLSVNRQRVDYWLSQGAQPTITIRRLLKLA